MKLKNALGMVQSGNSWIVTLDVLKYGIFGGRNNSSLALNSNIRCIEMFLRKKWKYEQGSWIVTLDVLKCSMLNEISCPFVVE